MPQKRAKDMGKLEAEEKIKCVECGGEVEYQKGELVCLKCGLVDD